MFVSKGGRPWYKSYDPGFPKTMDYPEETMYNLFVKRMPHYAKYTAFEFLGTKYNFNQFKKEIDAFADGLLAIGVKPGDKITICLPNTPHAMISVYATNKLGCIANMIHPLTPSNELKYYIEFAESQWLIVLDAFYHQHKKMLDKSPVKKTIICSIPDYLSPIVNIGFWATKGRKIKPITYNYKTVHWKSVLRLGKAPACVADEIIRKEIKFSAHDPAVYLHSGGTTGSPKTIVLSSHNFNCLALQGANILGVSEEEIRGTSMVSILPLFHGFGLCMGMHTMVMFGIGCILVPQFSAEILANIINKKRPNYIAGVPTLFEAMLRNEKLKNSDLSCLLAVFCGGDTLPIELKKRFDEFLKERNSSAQIREGYGLTETVTVNCVNQNISNKAGSVGIPLSDILIKICEPGTETELPIEKEGEICVAGPTVMLEYLKAPKDTSNTLRLHKDGYRWIHTGDYGFMDEDGLVYFKQRLKRIIKCSGVPVFPSQVEDVIAQLPEVQMVCVIGIPDEYQLEKVKALVVPSKGVKGNEELVSKIKSHCKKNLLKWSVPAVIEFRDELPLTKVGKIDYVKLTNQAILDNQKNKNA